MLDMDPADQWALGERETICVHNCAKSMLELKGFLHMQLLKDYTSVRKKNRNTFEDIWLKYKYYLLNLNSISSMP